MSADLFLQDLTQVIFVAAFIVVAFNTFRRPSRAGIDTSLFFGAISAIVAVTWIADLLHRSPNEIVSATIAAFLMTLPYLLLRLVDDFDGVSARVMNSALAGLILSILALYALPPLHLQKLYTAPLVLYFVVVTVYCAVRIVRAARTSSGITRRRMRAVALGTLCLGVIIVIAGLTAAIPKGDQWPLRVLSDAVGLVCAVAFYMGFAPPVWLRRLWQEPELRSFLGRAASLPRLPTTDAIVAELEHGAASSLGTNDAAIALWDAESGRLRFRPTEDSTVRPYLQTVAQQAFDSQRPLLLLRLPSVDSSKPDPGSTAAVPITAGRQRLGVLTVYAARAPIFADDTLALTQLLADQAAVILESRALIDEAALVQAREEVTKLKDDFLSAAAHDLKTPLTALIAQAQLLERRARRDPDMPADMAGIRRMVDDSLRLRHLITELLDVGRVEQGRLLGRREEVDMAELARQACSRLPSSAHTCSVNAPEPVIGVLDPIRIKQLLGNLLENAIKYSPDGGSIEIRVWSEGGDGHLSVTDRGIGIPQSDLPNLFDRFHRGTNVDDRRFSGMGLGLFICKGIAEQHGGWIEAASAGPNEGSTFHVALPLDGTITLTSPSAQGPVGAATGEITW